MRLTKSERAYLIAFVGIAQKLLGGASVETKNGKSKQTRRSAADVARMKKQIRAARKKKVPATQIAKKLGVTTSYVYQLGR